MADSQSRRYCCIIHLKAARSRQDLATTLVGLKDLISRDSGGEYEMILHTPQTDFIGFFLISAKPAAVLRANFESSPNTRNEDGFLLFEVGEQFNGTSGFSRAWTWLQHH